MFLILLRSYCIYEIPAASLFRRLAEPEGAKGQWLSVVGHVVLEELPHSINIQLEHLIIFQIKSPLHALEAPLDCVISVAATRSSANGSEIAAAVTLLLTPKTTLKGYSCGLQFTGMFTWGCDDDDDKSYMGQRLNAIFILEIM
ncbi:hypothetical protein Bca101_053131 [Brassica carinata]